MRALTFNQQKPTDIMWADESGMRIPVKRITPSERKRERSLADQAKKAIALNANLVAFKSALEKTAEELYQDFLIENDGKIGKNVGNVTLYNFDKSIKLVVKIGERISLDENFINLAKAELDEMFAQYTIDSQDTFITDLVQAAFETSGGKLDYKKILTLRKHASRSKNKHWEKAMVHIDKSISKMYTKAYHQIWVRDGKGEYQAVQLNFVDIEVEG
ncbi:MAG TPA: DUF3164 family protein [Pedobacter sp.]|uniref:DUF3164 family protein n=1 Tax=Pedobacter sp. TaxID=1411316 RepID=UPI002C2BBA6B|nr:DUF3164 family protein [Pedobacter sp.]HMI03061.1 DUF3164 family protein [Pedobacter sp.]